MIENKWIKRLVILFFVVIPMIGGIFSLYTTNPNVFTEFPHKKFSTLGWILNNCIYLLNIVVSIATILGVFTLVYFIKKKQNGEKIPNRWSMKNKIELLVLTPVSLFFLYPIFIDGVLTFINKTFISNPQYETKNVVIYDLESKSNSYYAKLYYDTYRFTIEIDSTSYNKYSKGDTLELKLFKGYLGLTEIDSYRKINLSNNFIPNIFNHKNFSRDAESKVLISASNMHTKIANLSWDDDIKQYEITNIHYTKTYEDKENGLIITERDYSFEDLYEWDWYAEKSTWEEKENPWHPFSRAEITYILKERRNAEKLHFLASVEGINGLVILPDKWDITDIHNDKDIPDSLKITPTTGVMKYSANVFTDAQWGVMQYYGAIFLPAAGYVIEKEVVSKNRKGERHTYTEEIHMFENQKGYYWTSTPLKDKTKACCLVFSEDHIDVMQLDKSYHCSIRMIMKY